MSEKSRIRPTITLEDAMDRQDYWAIGGSAIGVFGSAFFIFDRVLSEGEFSIGDDFMGVMFIIGGLVGGALIGSSLARTYYNNRYNVRDSVGPRRL